MSLGNTAVLFSAPRPFKRTCSMAFWISLPHRVVVRPKLNDTKGVCPLLLKAEFSSYSNDCAES